MPNAEFIKLMQDRIAELAVGPSAVRNQGAAGIPVAARKVLKKLDLRTFRTSTEQVFQARLDSTTQRLMKKLPRGARNWGTARKILNLFLRDALYNRFLCEHFSLRRIESWLEVPLDSFTAKGIKRDSSATEPPRWVSIKSLTPVDSAIFQNAASAIALQKRTARAHLDLWYWRRK